jgi:hypothetical protein
VLPKDRHNLLLLSHPAHSSALSLHTLLQGTWLVKDTSTNGTFIDGAKIGKGNTCQLQPGQRLGLSIVAPAAGAASAGFVNTVE